LLLHECRLRIDRWLRREKAVDNIGRYCFVIVESTRQFCHQCIEIAVVISSELLDSKGLVSAFALQADGSF
jgi:hypothetical protein